MTLLHPHLLWTLALPFGILAFFVLRHRGRLSRIFDRGVLARLSVANEGIPLPLRNGLLFLAGLLMVIALARPVIETGDIVVRVEGLSLLTALDISGSMRSKDVYPNRLTFAKKKMDIFFDTMPSDEIGVVAFAHSPFVLAPFSTDKETLKRMVDGVDDSYINMGSTDFLALGELAASLLKKKDPKIMVLFTDGGDEEAIAGLADLLKREKIDLYVVLVGSEEGAPVLDAKGRQHRLKDGNVAISKRNDTLGLLAKEHGGDYVLASMGREDIEKLVATIKSRYKNKQQGEVTVKQQLEYFYYPLGLGIFLMLIALSSLPRRREDS